MNIGTCSYQEFHPSMGIPVRCTAGGPRFPLPYEITGHATLVTPTWPMLRLEETAYEIAYRRLLKATGAKRIHGQLLDLHRAVDEDLSRPLILLCFERLSKPGAFCHRSMFADWWLEATGQEIPELGTCPPPDSPRAVTC